jgi:hypothetical protein
MNPEDEAGMNRVLDTLQIPRGFPQVSGVTDEKRPPDEPTASGGSSKSPFQDPPAVNPKVPTPSMNLVASGASPGQDTASSGNGPVA